MKRVFNVYRFKGILIAKSPIVSFSDEKTGSVQTLRRMKFIVGDRIEEIPYISGNSIRGVLRRYIFRDFLDKLGYEIDISKKSGQLLYHAFFSGGVLEEVEQEEAATIDVELKRKIYNYIIPARLLGFAYKNQMIEGKLKVGHALPICKELEEYTGIKANYSVYDLITHSYQTRRDELRIRKEEEQAIQMMVEYECFSPGTRFYHEFIIEDADSLDLSCFARMIELWKERPFIGGKSASGFGRIEINYDIPYSSKEYLEFIKKNKEKIIKVLEELQRG